MRAGCGWVDTSVLAGLVHAPLLWKLLPDHVHSVSQEDGSAYFLSVGARSPEAFPSTVG